MDVSALLAQHPVIDGHNDLLWEARERAAYDFTRLDVGAGGTPTHTDLPRMRAGGLGAQFWSVYVPCRLTGDDAVSATLEQVDAAHLLTSTYADQLAWATTADEVEQAWADAGWPRSWAPRAGTRSTARWARCVRCTPWACAT
jgi:membrane dipeptidase